MSTYHGTRTRTTYCNGDAQVLYKHDIDNFDTVSKSVSIMLNMIFPDHFGFEVESLGFARYWGPSFAFTSLPRKRAGRD